VQAHASFLPRAEGPPLPALRRPCKHDGVSADSRAQRERVPLPLRQVPGVPLSVPDLVLAGHAADADVGALP